MGKTSSGKSTVAKALASNTGLELYEIGHEVKKVFLEKISDKTNSSSEGSVLSQSTENSQGQQAKGKDYTTTTQRLAYTDEIVKKYGSDYYVRRILKRHKTENIILIGVRSIAEINAIKRKVRFPFFVGLVCDEEERRRRFIKRECEFMPLDKAIKIFEERNMREREWGVESILNQANINLQTNGVDPSDLATEIIERYKEFVRQKVFLEKKIIESSEFSR